MHFLQELVQNYLILAHPKENFPEIGRDKKTGRGNIEEDSFSQYYSSDIPKNKEKKPAAVKLKGEKLLHADMQITEVVVPVRRRWRSSLLWCFDYGSAYGNVTLFDT